MKNKTRTFIVGFLYVVALFSLLGAITATSRGSMLDFSNLARLIFCGLAVICVIAATLIWKATDARGKRNKIIVMLVAIAVIVGGGLIDSFFSAPGRGTLEYVSAQFPFGVTDMEKIEAYHYEGVPVNAEKKTVTDTQTMTYLYETFNSLMLQEKEVEELTGASVTSFRFVLKDGTEYNLIYVGNGVKSGKLKRNDGTSYFTSADIGQMWVNLSGEAVPADESELPDVTIISPTTPLEHDLSVAGDLKLSEHIEKDTVFVASSNIYTNSEKISVTNNGDSVLNIYLYNNREAIREFSLNSGSTDTVTGLNGKNSYQIGVSADDSILIDLTITD